ncbi:serine protease FAM111A-like [Mustelus asterias]
MDMVKFIKFDAEENDGLRVKKDFEIVGQTPNYIFNNISSIEEKMKTQLDLFKIACKIININEFYLLDICTSVGLIFSIEHDVIPWGTCFVFSQTYLITCKHVIKDIPSQVQLWVSFNNPATGETSFRIRKIVMTSKSLDYALFEIDCDPYKLPRSLLQLNHNAPNEGAVCMIGYPGTKDKKINFCPIIPFEERQTFFNNFLNYARRNPDCDHMFCGETEVKDKLTCIHRFTEASFQRSYSDKIITYFTMFSYGSSGSPIIDSKGNLVGMVRSGYVYEENGDKKILSGESITIKSILKDIESNKQICNWLRK